MPVWGWLLTALCTVAAVLAAVALVGVRRALEQTGQQWLDSVAEHKVNLLRTEVANLRDLYEHQSKLYRQLTARQGKRDARESPPVDPPPAPPEPPPQPEHALPLASGEPSPYTDPEGWKRWKRAQLATARLRG